MGEEEGEEREREGGRGGGGERERQRWLVRYELTKLIKGDRLVCFSMFYKTVIFYT